MTRTTTALAIAAALLSFACKKDDASPTAADAAPIPAPATDAAPSAAADAEATPAGPVTWTGTYEATPGTMHVPEGKEWERVKFRGEESPAGLGSGTLTLAIDERGDAVGTLEGPLGPGVVSGSLDKEGVLTARISPKAPEATSFYGTLSAKREGDAIAGTMNLSQGEARVIREAKFKLAKK